MALFNISLEPPLNSQALSFWVKMIMGLNPLGVIFPNRLITCTRAKLLESMITQQFVVTSRGDMLFNHPSKGIIQLDIHSGLVDILIPKRFDNNVGDNGNNNRWSDAVVDDVGKISIDVEQRVST